MDRFTKIFNRVKQVTGQQIQPENKTEEEVLSTLLSEIKNKYKTRYNLYKRFFLHERRIEKGQEPLLSTAELSDMRHYLSFLNSLDKRVKDLKSREENKIHPLRLKMIEGVLGGMEQGYRTGYISAPTQSGKTWAMTEIIKSCEGKRVILCDSQELVKQTSVRLHESGVNNSVYYGNVKESLENDVLVTTYDSFRNLTKKGKANGGLDREEIDLLVLDEGHEALGKKTREQITEIKELGTNIIGLSATPEFHEEKSLLGLLDHCYCDISIKEAGEEGLIANFKSVFAFTETDLSEVTFKGGEYNDYEYLRAIKNEKRTKSIWELYDKYLKVDENGREQKGLVFANRIEYIEHMHEYFRNAGISCAVITGSTGDSERTYLINEWKRGNLKILFGVQAIAQGISFDGGDFVVCADGTFSKVRQGQRCGRCMGVDFSNPDRVVKIVEIIDKDSKRNLYPVTFPQIAKATELVKVKVKRDRERESEDGYINIDLAKLLKTGEEIQPPQIEGLKVTINAKEIMEIVSQQERYFNIAQGEFLKPEELLGEIKKYPEIVGERSYIRFVYDPQNEGIVNGWPKSLATYLDQRNIDVSCNEWLGGKRYRHIQIEPLILLQEIQKYPEITGKTSYERFMEDPINVEKIDGWPKDVTSYLKRKGVAHWEEWPFHKYDRLNRPQHREILEPEDFYQQLQNYPQITNRLTYREFIENPENKDVVYKWPANFHTYIKYRGLADDEKWKRYFNDLRPKELQDLDFVKSQIIKYELTSEQKYLEFINNPENLELVKLWPRSISGMVKRKLNGLTYAEWIGEKPRVRITIEPQELLLKLKNLGIKTQSDYYRYIEGIDRGTDSQRFPDSLDAYLRSRGVNLTPNEWLGNVKKQILPVDELLQEIKKYPQIKARPTYKIFFEDPSNSEITKNWPRDLDGYIKKNGVQVPVGEWITGEKYSFNRGSFLDPATLLKEIKKHPEIIGKASYERYVGSPQNTDKVVGWPKNIDDYCGRYVGVTFSGWLNN